jgi:hypothetical protein
LFVFGHPQSTAKTCVKHNALVFPSEDFMTRILTLAATMLLVLTAGTARAQDVAPTYSAQGYQERLNGFVSLCPSSDGTNTAVPCSSPGTSSNVTIVGPTGLEGGVSVSVNPLRKDADNDSGTVTVGGAWQEIVPSNSLRTRIFIQNYCSAQTQGIAASESMFLNLGPTMPTSLAGAIELTTCGVYDSSSFVLNTQPVWLYAVTQGHKFVALQW